MKHSETAFIPLNDASTQKRGGPWFAIACLDWTASGARKRFTDGDTRGHQEAWRHYRKGGWRVVKVKVSVIR